MESSSERVHHRKRALENACVFLRCDGVRSEDGRASKLDMRYSRWRLYTLTLVRTPSLPPSLISSSIQGVGMVAKFPF